MRHFYENTKYLINIISNENIYKKKYNYNFYNDYKTCLNNNILFLSIF